MRAILSLLTFFLSTALCQADDMRPASLTISQLEASSFDVIFKVPARENARLKLDVSFDDKTEPSGLRHRQFSNQAYIESWQIEREALAGMRISIEGFNENAADVLVRVIDLQGQTITTVLNADKQHFTIEDKYQDQNTFIAYTILGIEHILVGLDHLLFVACLIYISRSGRKLLLTITGFTIAHSLTLILATTDTLVFPIAPVEAVIALSIVLLAWEIAKNRQHSLTLKYPVAVSTSFGLLHGFGFASVLSDIGLPPGEKWQALLSFNIGVEIGQLLFVAALYVLFALSRLLIKSITLDKLRFAVSYCCGSVAMYWLFQRLAAF
ncbi:HupE/UreJ family protein [Thalassotalea mangrovi]|uniref:HupE/UreJ family protein n=1 Tax=Thalassotalea mangrovi TaxID=2572245 RepID=A0A4V5NXF9_9GAMM|nr:HupE/UreJ family protein [Thalassotalea mangrovi]TKB46086.1 HupE/UreJ family protein [Thalassotalea mangrovi]